MLLTAIFVLLKACTEASSALNGSNDLSFQVISPTIIKWLQTRKNKRFLPVVVKTTKKNISIALKPQLQKKNQKKTTAESQKKAQRIGDVSSIGVVYLAYIIQIMDWAGYCKLIKWPIAASIGVPRAVYRRALRRMPKFSNFCSGKFASFHSTLFPAGISRNFIWTLRFSEFKSFQNFRKRFCEISVPFDAVSKFSKVLVEWKTPLFFRTEYSK